MLSCVPHYIKLLIKFTVCSKKCLKSNRFECCLLLGNNGCDLKVAFFRKWDSFFKSPKKIFQKSILNLKFQIPAHNILNLSGPLLHSGTIVLRRGFVKKFWNIIVIVIVVEFYITLPSIVLKGKVIKKSTTMTMTMTFQNFLTCSVL